jgi:hypothetical protein
MKAKPSPTLDATLDWLRDLAAYARACPSNETAAKALSIPPETFSGRLTSLKARGAIAIERERVSGMVHRRRIRILAPGKGCGKVTGWSSPPSARARAMRGANATAANAAGRHRDLPNAHPVPLPSWSALAATTDVAATIHAEAQRMGKAPTDFLAQLVALGWDVWRDQVGATSETMKKEAGHAV